MLMLVTIRCFVRVSIASTPPEAQLSIRLLTVIRKKQLTQNVKTATAKVRWYNEQREKMCVL